MGAFFINALLILRQLVYIKQKRVLTMKKLVGIIAGLKMGMSSIVMGSTLEVVGGGGFLVGVDRLSQQEIPLVREGEFQFDPLSGRFENEDVTLLSWNPNVSTMHAFNLERMIHQICMPTTEIELVGNLSSGSARRLENDLQKHSVSLIA